MNNIKQCDKERELVKDAFEKFVAYELKIKEFRKDENGDYTDPQLRVYFHLFRAGYFQCKVDINRFGDPSLERLYGMKHPNIDWWDKAT